MGSTNELTVITNYKAISFDANRELTLKKWIVSFAPQVILG